ncbi:hypothetical protein [Streptomyces sp. NPDC048256]|uniref:hypothetical protein n=1 Tax=unclassified Streptomyces TaxID=2593676 RepID=UPI0033C971D0
MVGIGTPRPPVPEPDCAECADLAARRESARAAHDRSAETDANVLLRGHRRREHESREHGNDECRAPERDPALVSTDEETRDQQPIRRPAR